MGIKVADKLPACPAEVTLHTIGSRRTVRVLRGLSAGIRRFGELRRSFSGLSRHSFTNCLRAPEEDVLKPYRLCTDAAACCICPGGNVQSLEPILRVKQERREWYQKNYADFSWSAGI